MKSVLVVASLVLLVQYVACISAVRPKGSTRSVARSDADGRLPRNVIPTHYNIEVKPNIYTGQPPFPFDGYEEIYITGDVATTQVVLNWKGLSMVGVDLRATSENPIMPPSPILIQWTIDTVGEFLVLDVVNDIQPGYFYVIQIYFSGVLRNDGNGLYYDSYVSDSGETEYIVATQMESIEARTAFPCFDEPDMKATFNVTVVTKPPGVVLGNMDVISTEERGGGWVATYFGKSPIMSTYQFAIAVGNFTFVEAQWENITTYPVRIYARPDMERNLNFAAYIAPRFQSWLEDMTGIPYTLPKMDHIALPSKRGAMENWGLITYGEDYLCVDVDTSGIDGIITVSSVVAHELAHQWYGNYVTMTWWNDIWLNEGFATYYNFYPGEDIGWPGSEQQQGDDRRGTQQFLDVDCRNTSDPVRKVVNTVWQADASFSGSTYPKGGAMLRHLEAIVTQATFRKGLNRYLQQYAYKTATTDDFWAVMAAQATDDGVVDTDGQPIDVKYRMDAWLNQMGYPLVQVHDMGDGTLHIMCERFFNPRGQEANTPSDYNYEWNVPISVFSPTLHDEGGKPLAWIELGSHEVTIPTPIDPWFLINTRQTYFYRVQYDPIFHTALVNQLDTDFTQIPVESRAALIDDAFTVARVLRQNETMALEMTKYLREELYYNPWSAAMKHFRYADRVYQNFMWHPVYYQYMMEIMVPVYNQTGWDYDQYMSPQQAKLVRDMIINTCYYGYAPCRDIARSLWQQYILTPDIIDIANNNLPTALCIGIQEGTSADWSTIFQQYQNRRKSPIREERYAFLFGLACSTDTTWLNRMLSYIIQGTLIDPRDANQALFYLIQSKVAAPLVWSYLDNSWNTVPSWINRISAIRNIAILAFDDSGNAQYNNFIGKYPPASNYELEQYRQIDLVIQQNIDWVNANADDVGTWLINHTPRDASRQHRMGQKMTISPMAYYESLEMDFDAMI